MVRLLAVVLLAALALAGCGDHSSSAGAPPPTATSPAPPAPQVVHAPFRCPGHDLVPPPDGGSATVPRGATAALICMLDGPPPWSRPTDVLTRHVGRLIATVNDQVVDRSTGPPCLGGGDIDYRIVLRYDGGTRTVTGGSDVGCSHLIVGPSERVGSRHVLFRYLRLLDAQRDSVPEPAARAHGRFVCHPPFSAGSMLTRPERAVAAVVCGAGEKTRPVARLDAHDLAAFRHDVATSRSRRTELPGCAQDASIVGRDHWGDTFEIPVICGSYRLLPPGHGTYRFVRMLPATSHLLHTLLAG